MKKLIGILSLILNISIAHAACPSYTNVPSIDGQSTSALENVVIEAYNLSSDHLIFFYAESLDYQGVTYQCAAFSYNKTITDSTDDLYRDEVLKQLKLSMALGYTLRITGTYSDTGSVPVGNLGSFTIAKP